MSASRWMSLLVAVVLLSGIPVAPRAEAATSWPSGTHRVSLGVERLAGADRYETSVTIARKSFPAWSGVDHVIVASGEDRAMADPLAAASLCWAYDAPLLLVGPFGVPPSVRTALGEMRSVNGTVTVTVVGGPVAVPSTTVSQLQGIVGHENVQQPWTGGDRYTTAAGVAALASQVASETGRAVPARAIVANGTDAAGFADALAASAVSAATGIPILLVERDRVPAATRSALNVAPPGDVLVVGGTAVVSQTAYGGVGASERWAGGDRHGTAAVIAAGARARGWLTAATAGMASSAPDALTGATYMGRVGGPMLYVAPTTVRYATADYLHRTRGVITSAVLFGGSAVLTEGLVRELRGSPTAPHIVAPTAGAMVAKRARLAVTAGVNTTELRVFVGGTLVASRQATSYATVDFGLLPTPAPGTTYRIVARNVEGGETAVTRGQPRHTYPAPTSIVVDKSDFRLYFFKDDVFVKSYPVAIGRTNAETPVAIWRIDSKYYTSPTSVYGPRKMRMYRKVGSRYVYTAYNIHGTNQPSSIGTKASAGCIRLYNADILDLFPRVPLGTIVQTRE